MKQIFTTIGTIALLAGLSGCAGFAGLENGTRDYDPDASRAHNLAGAAGIHIRDTAVSQDQYGSLMSDMSTTASNALLFNSSYGLGMTNWGSLGMGVMSTMFSEDDTNEHNSLFGWMPASMADSEEDAAERFALVYAEAIEKHFADAEIELYTSDTQNLLKRSQGVVWSRLIIAPEYGCPDNRTMVDGHSSITREGVDASCKIAAVAATPRGVYEEVPQGVDVKSPAYFFSSQNKINYSRFILVLNDSRIDPVATVSGISKHLPPWAFIYLAPERDKNPPIVFDQGQPELFVVPENA